jgi:hypothetical protein
MHIRDTRNSGPLGKVQHLTAKTQNVNTELGELMMQTMCRLMTKPRGTRIRGWTCYGVACGSVAYY